MKRKIASLDVYIDLDTTDTASNMRQYGSTNYELTMYPNQGYTPAKTRDQFQSIMAHELGHFVAMVSRDPTHYSDAALMGKLVKSPTLALAGERKAWEIAHTILPTLLDSTEQSCLKSYETASASELNWIRKEFGEEAVTLMREGAERASSRMCSFTLPEPEPDDFGRWDDDGGAQFSNVADGNYSFDEFVKEFRSPVPPSPYASVEASGESPVYGDSSQYWQGEEASPAELSTLARLLSLPSFHNYVSDDPAYQTPAMGAFLESWKARVSSSPFAAGPEASGESARTSNPEDTTIPFSTLSLDVPNSSPPNWYWMLGFGLVFLLGCLSTILELCYGAVIQ